ncbi:CBS domain-containing protein [Micromonospora coriariae]|uniref:CBS domain-containing protein n=2 Tax=Micromonospora coriariae TaxID=285665 RepID=A0A1C4X580_9ACTN|nr:CBS domain-containing protein [Micromonospora coriariae]
MKAIYIAGREPDGGPGRLATRPVTEVMSSPVFSVDVDILLGDALEALVRTGRRHLVAVDGAGRCLGVLADRAVAAAWAHDHAALSRLTVAAALDPDPATVSTDARVIDAARLMRAGGIDAVAIVDADGRPVGIVTGSDLIALLAR